MNRRLVVVSLLSIVSSAAHGQVTAAPPQASSTPSRTSLAVADDSMTSKFEVAGIPVILRRVTANNVVAENNLQTLKAESINELGKLPQLADAFASSKLTPTVPYSVNNNVKFFSVPVQAGYLLVNKKFGLQLNAGVSTDLFLENTITPEGGSLNATTQGRGDESPYRSVNFSGLMGTEFSYRFGTHYRLALNPGVRYPLNSVYKSDVGIQSTPLTFDVGLRFKYIFH